MESDENADFLELAEAVADLGRLSRGMRCTNLSATGAWPCILSCLTDDVNEKIRTFIRGRGFVVEMRAISVFRRRKWLYEASATYLDADEQKAREIDLYGAFEHSTAVSSAGTRSPRR
jgi:hypothetical protein